jgi:hypothetical protein
MAAAAISHLRRGAQRHALLHLSRRHFSNSPLTAAAPLAAAAARRLLSTTVEPATSSAAGSYKPPPLDPFRAALAPSSPPLEAPPLDELPTAPSHSEAAPEQDPVDLQHEELDGLKAGVQAVRSREESPQEKEAWWLLNRAVVNYCGSAVGTVAANDPSTANHMLTYDQVFIRDFVPSAIAFLLRGESDIVKNFLLHTLQLQVSPHIALKMIITAAIHALYKNSAKHVQLKCSSSSVVNVL